jgi:hypothetical protein
VLPWNGVPSSRLPVTVNVTVPNLPVNCQSVMIKLDSACLPNLIIKSGVPLLL